MEVELAKPADMEEVMSLVRAYERKEAVVAANSSHVRTTVVPSRPHAPFPRVVLLVSKTSTPPTTPSTMVGSTSTAPPNRVFKRLTADDMAEHRCQNLCFNCDEHFSRGHKCKHLFYIDLLNDLINMDGEASLTALLGVGGRTLHLLDHVADKGLCVLVD